MVISKDVSLWRFSPKHVHLVAQSKDPDFQRSSRSDQSDQPATDQSAELHHPAAASPNSLPFTSRIRFATGSPRRSTSVLRRSILHAPALHCHSLNQSKDYIFDEQTNKNDREQAGENVGNFKLIFCFKNEPAQPALS